MEDWQPRVTVPEIQFLRRLLGRIASSETGLADQVLQKFDRLVVVSHDPLGQDEAEQLATDLFEFVVHPTRKLNRPVSVAVQLQPCLVSALDEFMAEREVVYSRAEAVKMILEGALKDYGRRNGSE